MQNAPKLLQCPNVDLSRTPYTTAEAVEEVPSKEWSTENTNTAMCCNFLQLQQEPINLTFLLCDSDLH